MARRSIEQLLEQADASLPDNDLGVITPAAVRNMLKDFLDTVTPMYGGLRLASRLQPLTGTPTPLLFQTQVASFPPEWATDPATGIISRSLGEVAAMTSRFEISGDVSGSTNGQVTIELYRNNQATGWKATFGVQGLTKPVAFAFSPIDYVTADAAYKLMVSADFNGNYTFSNVQFIGSNTPVRTTVAARADLLDAWPPA